MRKFLIISLGQFPSLIGSAMTNFAITIWAWEVTGRATPLAAIAIAAQIPTLLISPFAGIWVDRFNRKTLMLLGDTVAGLSTLVLLTLFLNDRLQIWHLYVSGAVNGVFGYMQGLAYSASISLMVAERHYARASAFGSMQGSASFILAPALAGAIYPIAGLSGIMMVDLITFGIAIATLSAIAIPQPAIAKPHTEAEPVWQQMTFGFRYLWCRPSLRALLIFFLISNFINSASFSVLAPMLLARYGNDAAVMGTMYACFGMGGLFGGLTLSIWGGPKRRIHGVLIFNAIWKVGLMMLALIRNFSASVVFAFMSGFCSPFPGSCSQAIWRSQVEPEVQGRVFASRFLITQLAAPLGAAIAGLLADYVFEPAMQPGGVLAGRLGGIFGVGSGAGMSLQVTLFASVGLGIALGAYRIKQLKF
ncbi:MAG: MFS transporter [Cyanobacteria bacterium P01_E01_bin.42]